MADMQEYLEYCDDWEEDAYAAFISAPSHGDQSCDALPAAMAPTPERLRVALARLEATPGNQASSHSQTSPTLPSMIVPAGNATFTIPTPPRQIGGIDDAELSEAYLMDASRCAAGLEQAIIDYESSPGSDDEMAKVCRELHTLKGASAIAGLTDLAEYLHAVEDFVQSSSPAAIAEAVLRCVDVVHDHVHAITNTLHPTRTTGTKIDGQSEAAFRSYGAAGDCIHVKASDLDHLMDMVSALVMLRNQRESRVEQLRSIDEEVAKCSLRLRDLENRNVYSTKLNQRRPHVACSDPITEVANDLAEIGRALRGSYEPFAQENIAVSSFIQQFRQALVNLLRTPVSGLFQRLQRAAIDAARVEGKHVTFEVIGSDAGLERSVQERLFDPLMHIVRNAVSHGIEKPDTRRSMGKDPTGTITFEAQSAPNLLILSVSDDGRGLDFDALRRRGVELGLHAGEGTLTKTDLAQLIFRPGLSTRESANEIAGRGVGMDVVADTLDKMHSWIEVDSQTGRGTTMRLTVPLRSIIEHILVFRAGTQHFGIPMQFLKRSAGRAREGTPSLSRFLCGDAIGDLAAAQVFELRPLLNTGLTSNRISQRTLDANTVFSVDEVMGPEEVVIRPLPALFRHQSLFSGVTLSGSGQIVLVLDPRRLAELLSISLAVAPCDFPESRGTSTPPCALVVDDSLSARKAVSQLLQSHQWNTVEAASGTAAIEQLSQHGFAAVFTDCDMPNMDGLQLTRILRDHPSTTATPIVMLSSRTDSELKDLAIAAGATCCFPKPLTERMLEEVLSTLVSRSDLEVCNHE